MTKVIDLNVTVSPEGQLRRLPKITYISHEESVARIVAGGPSWLGDKGLEASDFPDGRYAAFEEICMNTHQGSHLDAPWHYGPTCEGKPAKTIEKWPLEWCYGDGVMLDFHKKERGSGITPEDLQAELKRIGYELKPFDIVLIRTDATKYYNEKNYEFLGIGVIEEATLWLIGQGIKVMGIDAFTWDKPFDCVLMVSGKKYWGPTPDSLPGYEKVPPAPETRKLGEHAESHRLGMKREYAHAENLANLDKLPPFGFKVCMFPIKIEGASAGWVRAVAILED